MDTHSHQVSLSALSKLYYLVQTNDPNEESLVTKVLDESSSFLLRKLLDDATEKIYENNTKKVGQPEGHLEKFNRSCTSSPKRTTHNNVQEEKASQLEHQKMVIDAVERIASFIPKLERLSNSYSNSPASSSASSYETTMSTTTTRRCGDDFKSSSVTQFGTSQSRTTSHSSFGSSFYHGDDELSPSEYYQSRQRSHKKMGNLSGWKDKSGSIVHHHHHHHHGQHPRDKNAEASVSLWKKYGKMFKSSEKTVEGKLEKKYMGMKKQSGNFQELGDLRKNTGDKLQQRRKGLRLRKKLLVLF